MAKPTLYKPAEAALQVKVHPKTLLRYARENRIGSVRVSRTTVLFSDEHIATFLKDNETRAVRATAPKPTRNPRYAGR